MPKRSGPRAHLKKWPSLLITPTWRQSFEEELEVRGRGIKSELAQHLGVSAGAISGLLRDDTTRSHLVAPVSKFLNIPLPMFEDEFDEMLIETLRTLRSLDPEFVQRLDARARKRLRELEEE